MSIENHIKRLINDHRVLDMKIMAMESSGHFDDDDLVAMKKRRLHLKDEVTRLQKSNEKPSNEK